MANEFDVQRIIGRLEEGFNHISDWNRTHQNSDDTRFSEIAQRHNDILMRLSVIEAMGDTVESHGDAIVTLERVQREVKEVLTLRDETHIAISKRDKMWLRIIGAAILALTTDHFTGSKLADVIGKLLH